MFRFTCSLTCFGRGRAQHALRIHAAAPEHQVAPEFALQLAQIHARRADLHRVENINPGVNQIGNQSAHRAAGVVKQLDRGLCLDE